MKIAVDASAVLAILLDEPDANTYFSKLSAASTAWISPVNWWEIQVHTTARYGVAGAELGAKLLESLGVEAEPVTLAQAKTALEVFGRYRGRPARLNMGDCFAYALAKEKGVPLLYKGSDFTHTDIERA